MYYGFLDESGILEKKGEDVRQKQKPAGCLGPDSHPPTFFSEEKFVRDYPLQRERQAH